MFKILGTVEACSRQFRSRFRKLKGNVCQSYRPKGTFANGTNIIYVESLYNSWLQEPSSVHPSWDAYFRSDTYVSPPNLVPQQPNTMPLSEYLKSFETLTSRQLQFLSNGEFKYKGNSNLDSKTIEEHLAVESMIETFQTVGFQFANLDPLQLERNSDDSLTDLEFLKTNFNLKYTFTSDDLEKEFRLPLSTCIGGSRREMKLKDLLKQLRTTYCGTIGIEFMHINNQEEKDWLRSCFEQMRHQSFSNHAKVILMLDLLQTVKFEEFLAKKYPAEKRFGIEGCEVLIPALKEIIKKSTSEHGVESIVMGMSHRGRLNVMANVLEKPLNRILHLFNMYELSNKDNTGDVKYHLGAYHQYLNKAVNKTIRLSLLANPSHLEAIDPVVLGKAHAEQFQLNDKLGMKVLPVLIHGDAAFAGQGVVFETVQLSYLPNYTTNGVIHMIANNQIGFTTSTNKARSSKYCTDVARIVNAPIIHVNADDPESVIFSAQLAANWRARFHKDIFIDLVGYRRYGHNEADEPKFTQPLMYEKIHAHPNVLTHYVESLKALNLYDHDLFMTISKNYDEYYDCESEEAQKHKFFSEYDWLDTPGQHIHKASKKKCSEDNHECAENSYEIYLKTGVDVETLDDIGLKFSSIPTDQNNFQIHKSLLRILSARRTMIENREVDWSMAEAMAFGSLLKEGFNVRLSGQDVARGTFSHRHHIIHDQYSHQPPFNPLQNLYPNQGKYTISNSSLSEYAIVGFEYGYSMATPDSLTIWEAQFGDFSNTAQCITDQFISSGRAKWLRESGLVLLLPHGMEGMGPEHSSARLERFLQMSSDDPDHFSLFDLSLYELQQLYANNWTIANCTTPANYFHILRRQLTLPFRRPLVLMTPKSLLRLPECKSHLNDMALNTSFQRILPDGGQAEDNPNCVEMLIFCTGRVYYDIRKIRDKFNLTDRIAIVRIEQIAPFPFDLVKKQIDLYGKAKIFWAQEEHKNQGAWSYVLPRFRNVLPPSRPIPYIGRPCSASTATGSKYQHSKELKDFLTLIVDEPNTSSGPCVISVG